MKTTVLFSLAIFFVFTPVFAQGIDRLPETETFEPPAYTPENAAPAVAPDTTLAPGWGRRAEAILSEAKDWDRLANLEHSGWAEKKLALELEVKALKEVATILQQAQAAIKADLKKIKKMGVK